MSLIRLLRPSRPKPQSSEWNKERTALYKLLSSDDYLTQTLNEIEASWYGQLKQSYHKGDATNREYYVAGLAVIDDLRLILEQRLNFHKNHDKKGG